MRLNVLNIFLWGVLLAALSLGCSDSNSGSAGSNDINLQLTNDDCSQYPIAQQQVSLCPASSISGDDSGCPAASVIQQKSTDANGDVSFENVSGISEGVCASVASGGVEEYECRINGGEWSLSLCGPDDLLGGGDDADWPNPQSIVPFYGDHLKLQFWDGTYHWEPGTDGGPGTCSTGLVQIEEDMKQALATSCPVDSGSGSLGYVTPCNPNAQPGTDTPAASGAVAASGRDLTPMAVAGPASEAGCKNQVESADPLQAGAVWYEMFDEFTGTGTSANWWWGAFPSAGGYDPADSWGGTQMSWDNAEHTAIWVAATGGGSSSAATQDVYICSTKDARPGGPDAQFCVLSSLFGVTTADGKLRGVEQSPEGSWNVFFRSPPL